MQVTLRQQVVTDEFVGTEQDEVDDRSAKVLVHADAVDAVLGLLAELTLEVVGGCD